MFTVTDNRETPVKRLQTMTERLMSTRVSTPAQTSDRAVANLDTEYEVMLNSTTAVKYARLRFARALRAISSMTRIAFTDHQFTA